jgi:hypothetical protein
MKVKTNVLTVIPITLNQDFVQELTQRIVIVIQQKKTALQIRVVIMMALNVTQENRVTFSITVYVIDVVVICNQVVHVKKVVVLLQNAMKDRLEVGAIQMELQKRLVIQPVSIQKRFVGLMLTTAMEEKTIK